MKYEIKLLMKENGDLNKDLEVKNDEIFVLLDAIEREKISKDNKY